MWAESGIHGGTVAEGIITAVLARRRMIRFGVNASHRPTERTWGSEAITPVC